MENGTPSGFRLRAFVGSTPTLPTNHGHMAEWKYAAVCNTVYLCSIHSMASKFFIRVKLVLEESQAWNLEDSGQNTAP